MNHIKKQLWALMFLVGFFIGSEALAEMVRIPLYELTPVKTMDLRCTSSQYSIKIPITSRWDVKRAVLNFSYVNSTALIPQNSRLVVKLNGQPLSQIRLNPQSPEGDAEVLLPSRLLKTGYNELDFTVAQHYTMDCEDPCAPELWTTLKLDQASVQVEYDLKPVPLKLSSVSDFLFDPKSFPHGRVHMVLENTSEGLLSLAATVASGISLRYDYRKVVFSAGTDLLADVDNILIGSKTFVEQFMTEKGMPLDVKGAYLKVMHLSPLDNFHALLIVSGENQEHIKRSAITLGSLSYPFPGTDKLEAATIEIPKVKPYSGRQLISTGEKYFFKTLGFPSHTFRGMRPVSREIMFRLPADVLIKSNRWMTVDLHMAYGAGMRADSVLNVYINGKESQAIQLGDVTGAVFSNYKLSFPAYLLKPGMNTITFEPVLTPLITGHCEYIQMSNLFVTIFDDSNLFVPEMKHWAEMPKMELFFQDGFPFTRWPDGRESMFYLTQADFMTIGGFLNMVGMMSQKIGYPLFNLSVRLKQPENWKGELIVLGELKSIPDNLKMKAPLMLTSSSTVAYPLYENLKNNQGDPNEGYWTRIKKWLGSVMEHEPVSSVVSFVRSKQLSGLGEKRGVIMEFQSPYEMGRTVLMITATSASDLEGLTRATLDGDVQGQCMGDMAIVEQDGAKYKVNAMKAGPDYVTGKLGPFDKFDFFIHISPWVYLALLVILVLILSFIIYRILKKQRRRRLKDEAGEDDNIR